MEIWGGIECSINRIQDQYFDQLAYQDHYNRIEDLEIVADLGISKIRYPILWEKNKPEKDEPIKWHGEKQLAYLRERNIEVIAGLVHHGSGPRYANVSEESFPDELAAYALEVAHKFPWIEYYTPINEPLTTARFCGLYGFWHPHQKHNQSFLKILYHECKATILAMRAIQTVNPNAKLVFTEDLGKCHSTTQLSYQAEFENHRRWLSIDLVCGKVNPNHVMWNHLIENGITASELHFLLAHAMPPAILGFNYYITSERFLDENLMAYPSCTHGGNHKERYADIEAIRTDKVEIDGITKLLISAWERYHLPMAITEAHLNCGREEQLRWFQHIHHATSNLEKEIDIKAITAWSLFGAYGWDNLLRAEKGRYEIGAFDVSHGTPRSTAITKMIKGFATQQPYHHPVITGKGWWERNIRLLYSDKRLNLNATLTTPSDQPLLIVGATGTLGQAFAKLCSHRDIKYKALTRQELDLCNVTQIEEVLQKYQPWAIINAAGFVRVDDAEADSANCYLSNTEGPVNLSKSCLANGIQFLTFSTDLVFDGTKTTAYLEDDQVNPLNIYGHSKAKAEELILNSNPNALIIRTSAFFGPWDSYNFVVSTLNMLKNNQPILAADDVYISPTYVPDLVNACLDLLIDEEKGIWHLANDGVITWADFAKTVAERAHFSPKSIQSLPLKMLNLTAKRPTYSVLSSSKSMSMPTLDQALDSFFKAG
jgi:dTDP-4-dehydrorhamnose reductase